MNIIEKLKNKSSLWAGLIVVLVGVLNESLNWNLDPEQVLTMVSGLLLYIAKEGYVQAKNGKSVTPKE